MKTEYEIKGNVTTIKLPGGSEAIIDTSDLPLLFDFNGFWIVNNSNTSKISYVHGWHMVDGKRVAVLLHRYIISPPGNMQTDHINRDGLDNRRENLRVVTSSQNQQNKKISKNNKSGVLGVYWNAAKNRWTAEVRVNNVKVFRKFFKDLDAAKLEISEARRKYMPYSQEALL